MQHLPQRVFWTIPWASAPYQFVMPVAHLFPSHTMPEWFKKGVWIGLANLQLSASTLRQLRATTVTLNASVWIGILMPSQKKINKRSRPLLTTLAHRLGFRSGAFTALAILAAAVFTQSFVANADPVEVYEDAPRTAQFVSAPFFGARSLIRVEYLRGKVITPGVSRTYLSKNVNIRINNVNFSGLEKTSAVLMSVCADRASGNTRYQDVRSVPLQWDGTAFQSDRYSIVFDYTAIGESYRCTQEIALVSNDNWMTDPISGSHNFSYSMADAR